MSQCAHGGRDEGGQAIVLVLGMAAVLMLGTLVLAGFGQALGGKARHQRGVDLASVSAARAMQADYPRLFEAAVLEDGRPNPRHLSRSGYVARARAVARRVGRANGVAVRDADVSFAGGFAPTRVRVSLRGEVEIRAAAPADASVLAASRCARAP